jgi:aspartate 1-decarboxylase
MHAQGAANTSNASRCSHSALPASAAHTTSSTAATAATCCTTEDRVIAMLAHAPTMHTSLSTAIPAFASLKFEPQHGAHLVQL